MSTWGHSRSVPGPSGPRKAKTGRRRRTPVSQALEALDVGKRIALIDVRPEEIGRARSAAAHLQRRLRRRYASRVRVDENGGRNLYIWRLA